MQSEKTNGIYSQYSLTVFLRRSNSLKLVTFSAAIKRNFLLILLALSFLSFTEKDKELTMKQAIIPKEIVQIADPTERAVAWFIYLVEIYLENVSQAKFTQQLEVAKKLWDKDYKHKGAIVLLTKADIDQITGYDSTTISNIEEAIQLLEDEGISSIAEKKLLCLSYISYAKLSKFFKKENEGLAYGYKAIGLAAEIDFPVGEMFAHNLVAQLIGYAENDMPLVLEHFEKAKSLLPKVPLNIRQPFNKILTTSIITTQSSAGQIEEAINTRLQLLKEEKQNGQNTRLLILLNNAMGADYFKLKSYNKAEKYLKETIELMNKHNTQIEYKGIPLTRLSLIKIEQRNIPLAISYADSLKVWLKNHQLVGAHRINYYRLESQLASANNDLARAVEWLEKATAERDSLRKIIGPTRIIKLEEESKFKEIQQEKLALEKRRDANKLTIYSQKILIFASIILIILMIVGYKYLQNQRKATDKNLTQNKTTKKSSDSSIENVSRKEIDPVLMHKIEQSLKKEKLFLSQELTLKKFADHLNSNTSYLSKTINEGFQKNFNALINDYRIEEVLRLFEEGVYQTYTIESIYQQAGFKSKSSFQKAFKAKTGQTASDYVNQLKLSDD